MKDRIVDSRNFFSQVADTINLYKAVNGSLTVKYREESQRLAFPCAYRAIVGGKESILELCDSDTVVIGPPGSALLECLLNDVPYYAYWNYEFYKDNQFLSRRSIESMMNILHIAKNSNELIFNIINSKIYKNKYSKRDLIYCDGLKLNAIVKIILGEN